MSHGIPPFNHDPMAPRPRAEAPDRVATLTELESRLDRHNLMIQTLLRLLLEKQVIQEPEFKEWLAYVDQMDGRADGRLRKTAGIKNCPACGRVNGGQAVACQYCGSTFEMEFLDKPRTME